MDFAWTDTQNKLYEDAVEFGRSHLQPQKDSPQKMSEVWASLIAFGAPGLIIPKELGGQGHNALNTARILEGLGYGSGSTGHLFALCAHLFGVAAPLLRFGTDDQKAGWLPLLASGQRIGAHATTESAAGSNPAEMRCTAKQTDTGYTIDGSKCYITNAPHAGLLLVTAATDPQRGMAGLSSFLIDPQTEGIQIDPPRKKMGLYPAEMSSIHLNSVRVAHDHRLHIEGSGAQCIGEAMNWERALILAPRIGAMQHHLELCIEQARQRHQFGKRIGHNQSVSHRIANMAVQLSAARFMVYHAAWSLEQDKEASLHAAMTKLFVSEVSVDAHLDTLRIFGGKGYLEETGVEKELRDSVGGLLHSGTSEIQLNIVASHLGL